MRFVSFLTAIVVTVVLYFLVLERDRVMEFVGRTPPPGTEQAADAPGADAGTEAEAPAARAGEVSVVVLRSQARAVADAVLVRGRTEAARQVDVRAETSSTVISEPLRKGALVETGQELCRLDPGTRGVSLDEAKARRASAQAALPEAQSRVAEARAGVLAAQAGLAEARTRVPEAEANLTSARAREREAGINLNAATRLSADGFASDTRLAAAEAAMESARAAVQSAKSQVEAARAGVQSAMSQLESARAGVKSAEAGVENARAGIQSAEAAVAAAQKEIDRLTVTAPFAGLLETDTAELGTLLQAGGVCATVIQLDPIKLVGFIAESEVGKVSPGATAGARLATGEEVHGTVTFLSRAADETTRTFRVEIEIPNPDLSIRDGQTAEIVISSGDRVAHLLPASAMTLDDDGQIGVRLVRDGRAAFAPVQVLRDTVEGVWVTGLPDSAEVIVVGQEYVTDGVPVAVTYREEVTQ